MIERDMLYARSRTADGEVCRALMPQPAEGLDYELMRPNKEGHEHWPDRDWIAYPCTCGAEIVVELTTPPGTPVRWRVAHGGGEAVMFLDAWTSEHLTWILGMRDVIGDWVRSVHRHEGVRP